MADLMNMGGAVIDGHPNRSVVLITPVIDDLNLGERGPATTSEPSLGVPPVDGYVLSKDTDGTVHWIPMVATPSGGGDASDVIAYPVISTTLVPGTNTIVTTLTDKPYSVEVCDSNGIVLSGSFLVQAVMVTGNCVIYIDSSDTLDVDIKILIPRPSGDTTTEGIKAYPTISHTIPVSDAYRILTTLTSKPYIIEVYDENGLIISPPSIYIQVVLVGSVYALDISTGVELPNVEIKILYQ
jgi:hypothetical protein